MRRGSLRPSHQNIRTLADQAENSLQRLADEIYELAPDEIVDTLADHVDLAVARLGDLTRELRCPS